MVLSCDNLVPGHTHDADRVLNEPLHSVAVVYSIGS